VNQITVSLIFLGCAAAAGYALLCIFLVRSWRRLPEWSVPERFVPRTFVTVVIPARNEADNIEACLLSVFQQNYPPHLLEIIVVDDHSEDNTAAIVESLSLPGLRLLRLADFVQPDETFSFKKKAIETAIAHARGELIVTTDADCTAPPDWLQAIVSLYDQRRPQAILASVGLSPTLNAWERFQALDMAGLMICSGALAHRGMPLLANGANLAYAKSAFETVQGFDGIDHLASGDDLMLVHKIATRFPGQVLFLKHRSSTVLTAPKPDVASFWQQRIRWATKTSHYRRPGMTAALGGIWLFCCLILLLLFLAIGQAVTFGYLLTCEFGQAVTFGYLLTCEFGQVVTSGYLLTLAALFFIIKTLSDRYLLGEASRFFGRPDLLRGFLFSEILHLLYMAAIGLGGLLKKRYEWKGRSVR